MNLKNSLNITRENIFHHLSNLPGNQRTSFWFKNSFGFTDTFPCFSYKAHTFNPSDLYNLSALFAKGLLLTTEIEIEKLIAESGDGKVLKMYEELRNQRFILQKLYETPKEERYLNLDSLENEANKLEIKLVDQSKVYGNFMQKLRTTWKDVQNALSSDEIAVEFLSFNVLGTDSTMIAALTLRKDNKEPKFTPLFELRQLSNVTDTDHYICPEVTNLIWGTLKKEFDGIRRIYFSPAGIIHNIAIENIPGIGDYDMYRLTSTREIIDMKGKSTSNQKDKVKAVLFGGVDYDKINLLFSDVSSEEMSDSLVYEISRQLAISQHRALIDSLGLRGIKADYLPNTLTEVQNISSSLEKANLSTILHVGASATEKNVKKLSNNAPTILHISTHGFYFSEKQARKEDNVRFLSIASDKNANVEDKSLARSGLLFAGANHSLKGEDIPINVDDGILTGMEISRLDLRGLDLVVLSACDTGKGDIKQGEGVFGLQRGFKKAGVQTILMSLWKVSDVSTEILMTEFYQNICKGKSKRESLRLAQNKVRNYKDSEGNYLFQDSHYWAGFVLLD